MTAITLRSKWKIDYPLPAGRRLPPNAAEAVRADVAAWYADGASIRRIAEHTGRSYGFVHRQLVNSNMRRRPRGGNYSRKRTTTK